MEINPVDLRVIDKETANVYEAVIVAGKRARQVNEENKIQFNAAIGTMPNNGNDDDSDDIQNPAQLKISLEFEKKEKPQLQALNELLEGEVKYKFKE